MILNLFKFCDVTPICVADLGYAKHSQFLIICLGLQAQDFRQQGTNVRRKMWLQNMKIKLIVLGIIIALILIIILSVCHGFKCH
jgi:hypothetical protein